MWWIVTRDIHRFAELDEALAEIRDLADRLVAVRAYCFNDLPVVCQGEVEDVVDGVSNGVSANSISRYERTEVYVHTRSENCTPRPANKARLVSVFL